MNKQQMRPLFILFFTLISTFVFSQTLDFNTLLQQGKDEFKKDFDDQDYENAVYKLEQAVLLNPDHAEAHYFLGCAYDRLNSKDGSKIPDVSLPLTRMASEQFEIVNQLTPKYEGETVALGPYSKLSSIWGAMAIRYWNNNMPDSAKWAFEEGKRRGGFGEFYLAINRKVLDFCSQNAVLVSSGDNFTIPLWYLQMVENYRTDVLVIDVSLLNSLWYPKFLVDNTDVSFGVPDHELDTIQYMRWSDSTITIDISAKNKFSWILKPSYYENYILRGDRLFLSLLIHNRFEREVYFTTAFIEDYRLSLRKYLNSLILIDRINYDQQPKMSFEEYESKINSILDGLEYLNINSQEDVLFVDNIRYDLFARINDCINHGKINEAKQLLTILDVRVDPSVFPFQSEQGRTYYEYLKQTIVDLN